MSELKANRTTNSVDMSVEAKQADIPIPVSISDTLVEKLRPNEFLMKLGITFDKRVANLLKLVRGNLEPSDEDRTSERSFVIPLIVVNGPILNEDVLHTAVHLQKNNEDEQIIFITDMPETDSNSNRLKKAVV